jgi:PASTA domain/Gametolysin peptidase M11
MNNVMQRAARFAAAVLAAGTVLGGAAFSPAAGGGVFTGLTAGAVSAATADPTPSAAGRASGLAAPDTFGQQPRPAAAAASVAGSRRAMVLTVALRESHGTPKTVPDKTPDQVSNEAIIGTQGWFPEVSHGRFTGYSAVVPFRLPITVQTTAAPCSDEWFTEISDQANDYARRFIHADPGDFDAVVYYIGPSTVDCGIDGKADIGRGRSSTAPPRVFLLGTTFLQTVVHELGHNLGLLHAGSQLCTDANGSHVPLSSTCTSDEYGDWSSAMGAHVIGGYSSAALEQLGWNQGPVRTISGNDAPATYFLTPLEVDAPGSLQALRVVDGDATLWLEYRRPIGVDRFGALGLLVRREQPGLAGSPFLLKMTSQGGSSFLQPAMSVGQTWANPLGVTTITLNSADATGASVTIRSPQGVPDLRGKTLADAGRALTDVGFMRGSVTAIADPNCEHLGLVLSQTPAPGTRLPAGSSVDFTFGTQPTGGCPTPQ